jgi:NAD+ synthase (glutamine-hydrolysing)
MSGGFAVIKDVVKTDVYALCRYKNEVSGREIFPRRVLEKAPSAELRPGQKDTDTLPSYEILDPILQAYVERDESPEEIIQRGFRRETVEWVIRNVDRNEYKRRQAPPGVKITQRAFGKDRRMPITNGYKH